MVAGLNFTKFWCWGVSQFLLPEADATPDTPVELHLIAFMKLDLSLKKNFALLILRGEQISQLLSFDTSSASFYNCRIFPNPSSLFIRKKTCTNLSRNYQKILFRPRTLNYILGYSLYIMCVLYYLHFTLLH